MASPLDASWSLADRQRGENRVALRAALNDSIWGLNATAVSEFNLDHYDALCGGPDTTNLSFATHRDVIELVDLVKNGRNRQFLDLRTHIGTTPQTWLANTSDATIRSAVKFAVSLWLMVDISSWGDAVSLCDFVHGLFPQSTPTVKLVEFELAFNARSLYAIGGFDLTYTSQLNEHLRLNKAMSEIYVFRHASLLGRRIDTGQAEAYPDGLLRETAQTLALLVPLGERRHKNWYRQIRKKADVDVEAGVAAYTTRNLDHYKYWRIRLEAIQAAYDGKAPKTLGQWVHDRRDTNRFYTFWFAVTAILLSLLFGLIQSVTGLYGVIKA